MRRRTFVQTSMAAMGSLLVGGCGDEAGPDGDGRKWMMPEEGQPHTRTWMAFGASERFWGAELVPVVQRDLAAIATTIARFEPVSILVRPAEMNLALGLMGGANIELVPAEIDDLWIRDTGPLFMQGDSGRAGVDLNFNGWGDKQEHRHDAEVARVVTERAGVERLTTDLVLEGGGIEVDGAGTAIITESCVLNSNRNQGWKKRDVEEELAYLLGIQKVIWLPGIAGAEITDGHTDFYARFTGPGVVVAALDNDPDSFDYEVTRRHLDILHQATDVHGRPLRVEVLEGPSTVRSTAEDFAAGYINFYVCNGAVIAPEFGDPRTDPATRATLERLFPDREIVQLNIDGIAAGGGGIHCATQQEPAACPLL
ncbi:agmatine/peptidylarginine deiminase [Nocardia sp. XZ_19_385]|uniref:agmatine deiminase family protein n=1 Tax=Nocardia sp. XZ_19_385 TaxID=2769488 RepID=UPI00188FD437|nr:agmatine deiminase family protein [Nocardia sp. XZ_19_385]